jgi:FG-GAP repeat
MKVFSSACRIISIVIPMQTFVLLFLSLNAIVAAQTPRFREHLLATDLRGGYQVVVADMNGDGKPDLIALASGMQELVWFENPGWQRHVLAGPLNRMINCAFAKIDGKPVIVVASEFNNDASKSVGIVSVLTPGGDLTSPWKVTEIDRVPTSHRIRTAQVGGQTVFINAPLTDAEARPPEFRGHVPIMMYRPGVWKRELIGAQEEGVLHGIYVEGPDSFLTASFVGIHRYKLAGSGWTRTELSRGDSADWPKGGSSDVTESKDWIAAIEPWHGSQVVVYDRHGKRRQIIDTSLVDGHTIIAADLAGNGKKEIIAGYRGKGTSVLLFELLKGGWRRTVLDSGMAAASCAAADLNGDGRVDITCIGSSTMNLKWYENLGR